MKKSILSAFIISAVFIGCSGDEEVQNPSDPTSETTIIEIEDTPSAKAEDDNKSSGVYKGTFVGSTGTFKLTLEKDNIKGVLVVDGVGHNLTTSDISNDDLGSAISNAVFINESGNINLVFSVDADGKNPSVQLTITGHADIKVVVSKEKSTGVVKIYEGFKYNAYPDDGKQCVQNLNIQLRPDNTASVTLRSDLTIDLKNGNSGPECDYEAWLDNDYNWEVTNNSIRVYIRALEDSASNSWIEDDILFGTGVFSDSEIYAKEKFTSGGKTYFDSLRLRRKL